MRFARSPTRPASCLLPPRVHSAKGVANDAPAGSSTRTERTSTEVELSTAPYAEAALDYWDAGWRGVIPLPAEKKTPPPKGYTGYAGIDPSFADVYAWTEERSNGNVALHLPAWLVGIDVDAYGAKPGARTLADLEAKYGLLPRTTSSTSRGVGDPSRIRVFIAVPPQKRRWRDDLDGIELIHVGHRYVIAEPSIHPEGRTYRWYAADGTRMDRFPAPHEFAALPQAWIDALTVEGEPTAGAGLGDNEIKARLASFRGGEPCDWVSRRLDKAVTAVREANGSVHVAVRDWSRTLVLGGFEGHQGIREALDDLNETFFRVVTDPNRSGDTRRAGEARGEFYRLVRGAVDKAPAGVASECECERNASLAESFRGKGESPEPKGVTKMDGDATVERFPRINWRAAFAAGKPEPRWIVGRLFERGQQVALVGDGKAGKSLFELDHVAAMVRGAAFLSDEPHEPLRVVYVDRENEQGELVDRLLCLGVAPDELDGLAYYSFPAFSSQLNVERGAAELLALVDENAADVVVLDTASRFITGNENDSETWLELYVQLHAKLKARGVAGVRIDHFGKDDAGGARGSSAKGQDVDQVWEMRARDPRTTVTPGGTLYETAIELKRTDTRTGRGPDLLKVVRRAIKLPDETWAAGGTSHRIDSGLTLSFDAEMDTLPGVKGDILLALKERFGAAGATATEVHRLMRGDLKRFRAGGAAGDSTVRRAFKELRDDDRLIVATTKSGKNCVRVDQQHAEIDEDHARGGEQTT